MQPKYEDCRELTRISRVFTGGNFRKMKNLQKAIFDFDVLASLARLGVLCSKMCFLPILTEFGGFSGCRHTCETPTPLVGFCSFHR